MEGHGVDGEDEVDVKRKTFKAEILSGHKEDAVEVPFDPSKEWGVPPEPLRRGRRGHFVKATINGLSFESSVVPRQKKFYLLIDAGAEKAAGLSEGVVVQVAVEPRAEGPLRKKTVPVRSRGL